MAFYIYKNLYIDIYPILANEYIYRDFNLCKCKFCGIYTYCNRNAYNIVNILYGQDYLNPIPKRKSKLEKSIIHLDIQS